MAGDPSLEAEIGGERRTHIKQLQFFGRRAGRVRAADPPRRGAAHREFKLARRHAFGALQLAAQSGGESTLFRVRPKDFRHRLLQLPRLHFE